MSQQDDGTETHLPGLFMGRTNQPAAYPVALVSRQHGNGGQRQRSGLFSAIRNDFQLCQQDVPRKGAPGFRDQREFGDERVRIPQPLHQELLPMVAMFFTLERLPDQPEYRFEVLWLFLPDNDTHNQ